ncbi:MAG: serine/threonine-protein kinase [Myxococcota bacterium]
MSPGARIGPYRVRRTLAQGGMGVVYDTYHVDLGRRFAVKVVRRDVDDRVLHRLVNEARLTSAIRHPHIVDVVHLGRLDEDSLYLVMELLEGINLADHLARRAEQLPEAPWLPDDESRRIGDQLLGALAAAHAAGVVHRDLKPENVFLVGDQDGGRMVKVLDFGIAMGLQRQTELRITKTGQVFGTPLYMAPEQTRSTRDVDGRADIYSLGVLLYEMVTGRAPFEAELVYDIIVKHATEPPVPPRAHRRSLPPAVEAVILRCLEKDREDRFDDTEALLAAWKRAWTEPDPAATLPPRAVSTGPIPAPLSSQPPPPRRAVPVTVGLGALLGIGLAAWLPGAGDDSAPVEAATPVEVGAPTGAEDTPPEVAEGIAPEGLVPDVRVPTRLLTSEPPGARVLVDGDELGTTPLEVAVGSAVTLELGGHAPQSFELEAGEGAASVTLEPVARRPRRQPRTRPSAAMAPAAPAAGEREGLLLGLEHFDNARGGGDGE